MLRPVLSIAVLLGCVFSIPVVAQNPVVITREGTPPSVAQILSQRHISLTKDALVSALASDDPEIRALAAQQLAVEDAKDTVPAMVQTLEVEEVPRTKINIAFALAQMGNSRGYEVLRKGCSNAMLPISIRLASVSYLLDLQDESCSAAVILGYEQSSDSSTRVQALSLIPDFKKLSANESVAFRELLLNALRDRDPGVRIEASDVIRMRGDVSAIPALEAAISSENNVDVRTQMETELKGLVEKNNLGS